MPAVRPTSFSRPDVLRTMHIDNVRALLAPHAEYLTERGIKSPISLDTEFEQAQLAEVLSTHNASTPPQLVENLELLSLVYGTQSVLVFEEDHSDLLKSCRGPDDTPADVAVKMLLKAPHIVWREFDRQAVRCKRSFLVCRASSAGGPAESSAEQLQKLEAILAPWFGGNGRGNWCRVRAVCDESGVTFLVRHGDLMNRVSTVGDDGEVKSQLFRPERLDLVHFRLASGEWQISGVGTRLREEYRKAFGIVFYGTPSALFEARDYSLKPLLRGKESVSAATSHVTLVKLESATVMAGLTEVRLKGGCVFTALAEQLMRDGLLFEAELSFKLTGVRYPVRVVINEKSQKIKCSTRIPVVEQWLESAGFRKRAVVTQELLAIA